MNELNHIKMTALKRYFVVLAGVLFLLPTVSFANDTLSVGAIEEPVELSARSTHFSGISNYKLLPTSVFEATETQVQKKKWFEGMRYSGNVRFVGFYRNMDKYYENPGYTGILTNPINISAGDGTRQPLFLLGVEGNPSASSKLKFEMNFDHLLLRRAVGTDKDGRLANLFVLFNFEGSTDTRIGNLKLIAGGGVNWHRISQSTFWGYQYRDDLFERYPWEPDVNDFERYDYFYHQDDIPRDARFGMQATQGFILEAGSLPKGFDAAILYGKNTQTGGFQSYVYRDPQRMFANRIGKTLGNHKIGFNYFDQSGNVKNKVTYAPEVIGEDTFYVESNYTSTIVTTMDARLKFKHFNIYTELGAGSYLSTLYNGGLKDGAKPGEANADRYKREWDETAFVEVTTDKELTFIPLKVNAYRIGANVVNNTSSVFNTSVEQAKASPEMSDEYNTNYYDGMVTEVGQLTNNRQGANITTFFNIKKLKAKAGLGFAQEIDNLAGDLRNGARANTVAGTNPDSNTVVPFTNSITFHQRLNGVSRSRFENYKRFTGPNSRITTSFRRTFENIAITDTLIDYNKSFSNFELQLKHKFKVFRRDLIITNFVNYSSVQENWSPIPVFTDKAFLRYFYEEVMAFYSIHQKVTLVGFVGMERVKGNNRTELADENGLLITDAKGRPVADEKGKSINQYGLGYGAGIDYNFDARSSLHLRSRWFTHQDKSFTNDQFKGNEITFEFKKFF